MYSLILKVKNQKQHSSDYNYVRLFTTMPSIRFPSLFLHYHDLQRAMSLDHGKKSLSFLLQLKVILFLLYCFTITIKPSILPIFYI